MAVLTYLLEASLCSAALYLFYHLLLKNTSFFQGNRAFLILSLAISFILPAVDITLEKTKPIKTEQKGIQTELHAVGKSDTANIFLRENTFEMADMLVMVYWFIATLIFLKSAIDVARLLLRTRVAAESHGRLKIFYGLTGLGNSSFFNLVFLDSRELSDLQKTVILTHERIHAQQGHSVDKLLLLLCRSVLWFNPVIYLYEQALENLHEYQADVLSARQLGKELYARNLIDLARYRQRIYPAHALSTHPLKFRIARLLAPITAHSLRWRYVYCIPLVAGLMLLFSLKIVYAMPSDNGFVLVVDAAHGGRDAGSTWENINEKELVLDIAKRIKDKGEMRGIKVLLTRHDDSELRLKDRGKSRGSLLISLHIDSLATERNGVLILTGNKSAVVKQKEQVFTTLLHSQLSSDKGGLKVGKNIVLSPQLYLLRQYTAPSVVLELGNLTNETDRTLLLSFSGRDAIAENIMVSVEKYKRHAQVK